MFRYVTRVAVVVAIVAGAVPFAPAAVAAGSIPVEIDLRPGSDDARLNMRGNATLPVAILSTAAFDATTVDATTVCFGDRDNALQRDCTEEHGTGHREDVDGDGDTDLLLHFGLADAGLDAGDAHGCLEGRTAGGDRIHGCDEVQVANGTPEAQLPDLSISLAPDQTSVDPHAVVTWTAYVMNDGPGASTVWPDAPLLRFSPPAGLTVTGVTPPAGYTCAAGPDGVRDCSPGSPDTLPAGDSRAFVLAAVAPDVPGVVNLSATADPAGAVAEVDETDNAADAPIDVLAANLAVALAAVPGAASPGEHLAWSATVTNAGPGAARLPAGAAVLALDLPAGLAGAAVQAPAGYACALSGSRYACRAEATAVLPVGGTLSFLLTATAPPAPGTYEVVATADPAAAFAEVDETDNVAKAAVLVQLPNLVAAVAPTPDPIGAGETFEWVVTVANTGPGRAHLPAGGRLVRLETSIELDGVTVTGPAGFTCAPGAAREYACTTDAALALAAGDGRTFRLRGAMPPGAPGADVLAVADPAGLVVESDEADNTATGSAVARLSDLAVTMTATPDPVDAAHTVQWVAAVRNTGTAAVDLPAGATVVRFAHPAGMLNLFAATPAGYSCFISAVQVVDCAATAATSIPAGAALQFTLGGTAPRQPGSITTTVTVDPTDLVVESDETNNQASAAVTVQPPDLSIALTATPDPVDALATTTWVARITNDGPAAARIANGTRLLRMNVPAGMLNLAVSTPPSFTCFIEAPQVVDCQATATQTIAPGAHVDITLFGTAPRQPGDITTSMTADPLDVLPEGDETDNAASATVTVQPPDLSVALTATPDPVDALATSTWVARVTNDGPANARISSSMAPIRFVVPAAMLNLAVSTPSGYTCFISAPQTVDCTATATTNLAAGAHVDFTLFGTAPRQPGPLSVTATADPLGAIPEGDETDNSATTSITVQPPDLSVALTATPDPVDARHVVTWVARVTNDGPANARISSSMAPIRFVVPAAMLNLAVSTPSGYTCFIPAPQTVDCTATATTNLAAGAHLDFTLFGTAPREAGPITVTATADPLGAIPEGDETDNGASATVVVRVPDLSAGISAPASVAPGDPVTYAVTVTNDGPAVARITSATVVARISVPAGLSGAAVTPPAGYSCAAVDATTIECRTASTLSIEVGGTATFTLTGTAPAAPGTLTVTAVVDPNGAIPETDESDNEATRSVTVT